MPSAGIPERVREQGVTMIEARATGKPGPGREALKLV
jgi:hypothetical protein